MGDSIDFNESWETQGKLLDGDGDLHESSSDEEDDVEISNGAKGETSSESKSLKKKRKFLEMKSKKLLALTAAAAEATAPSNLSAAEQYEVFRRETSIGSKLTPANFFELTSTTTVPCVFTSTILACIPSFKKQADKLTGLPTGSPTVLIICSSARRAADVINSLSKTFRSVIAKLFAKHFKLQEHVEFVKTQQFHLAVGTPNRVAKLMEYGALHLDQTQLILVDMLLDSKSFSVMTLPDTKADFLDLVESWILPKIAVSSLRLNLVQSTVSSSAGVAASDTSKGDDLTKKSAAGKSVQLTNSRDKFRHPKKLRK